MNWMDDGKMKSVKIPIWYTQPEKSYKWYFTLNVHVKTLLIFDFN